MATNDVYILKMNSNGDWIQYPLIAEAGKVIGFDSSLNPVMLQLSGLNNFVESRTVTAPNAVIPIHSFTASGTEANIDIAIIPKGAGAIIASIPNSGVSGGNKRGSNAVDFQMTRTASTQVASGANSFLAGNSNTASGINAVALGNRTNATGNNSLAGGYSTTASGVGTFAWGDNGTMASGNYSFASGLGAVASTQGSFATGNGSQSSGAYAISMGCFQYSYLWGQSALGINGTSGKVRQSSFLSLQGNTTDGVAKELLVLNSSRLVLKNNTAWAFEVSVLAHSSTNVLHAAKFKRSGLILRGATAGTTTLEGTVETDGTDIINANLSGCAVNVSADSSNGSLKVEVTGIASTTIIWQAEIKVVEIEI